MVCLQTWIGLLMVFVLYKWGGWKEWREYYPTILFLIIGNLIYNLLTKNNMLWRWQSPVFTHEFIEILWYLSVFPATVILFLPRFLKLRSITQKIRFVLFFVLIYSILEYIIYFFDDIIYDHGWHFIYSPVVYLIMFPALALHHRNPLLAWGVYFISAYSVLYLFKLPLMILK